MADKAEFHVTWRPARRGDFRSHVRGRVNPRAGSERLRCAKSAAFALCREGDARIASGRADHRAATASFVIGGFGAEGPRAVRNRTRSRR
jgi:hypothetical protein